MAAPNRVGRETRFEARLDGFSNVQAWIAMIEDCWSARLGRLAASLAESEDEEGGGESSPPPGPR